MVLHGFSASGGELEPQGPLDHLQSQFSRKHCFYPNYTFSPISPRSVFPLLSFPSTHRGGAPPGPHQRPHHCHPTDSVGPSSFLASQGHWTSGASSSLKQPVLSVWDTTSPGPLPFVSPHPGVLGHSRSARDVQQGALLKSR